MTPLRGCWKRGTSSFTSRTRTFTEWSMRALEFCYDKSRLGRAREKSWGGSGSELRGSESELRGSGREWERVGEERATKFGGRGSGSEMGREVN